MNMNLCANSRMRLSILLLVILTVLAATGPRLIHCRVLPSPTKTEKATLGHVKVLQFLRAFVTTTEKVNTEDNMSNRVLIENQFQTMSSGPSRRGSGH
ncbi:hypothetical protein RJT34_30788 [Clitoria ternatea]|uniref:Uncharacterized protein n=1 Tax=Clitoria ternatea TaxID=43366 RepID=A0AAN9I7Q7_CLITE